MNGKKAQKPLGAELHDVLNPYAKVKGGVSRERIRFDRPGSSGKAKSSARTSAGGVVAGHSEVMVKITNFSKGAKATRAHMTYITRNMQLEAENQNAEKLAHREELKDVINEWGRAINDEKSGANTRTAMHLMMSMPKGTEPEAVKNAAREFAHDEFGENHEYIFVLHTDRPHPHVHLVVRMLGKNGKRLNPRKADLMRYREAFAVEMRRQGVDAVATVRQARGVVIKQDQSKVAHAIDRKASTIDAKRIVEAVDEVLKERKGQKPTKGPWIDKIEAQRIKVTEAWRGFAEELSKPASKQKTRQISLEAIRAGLNQNKERARIYAQETNSKLHDQPGSHRHRRRDREKANTDLHQSGYRIPGGRGQATSTAGLRGMPSVNVVFHRGRAEQLLLTNARSHVDGLNTADHGMRRKNTRDATILTGNQGSGSGQHISADDVRRYVERLEKAPILTRRDTLKNSLKKQFALGMDAVNAVRQAAEIKLQRVQKQNQVVKTGQSKPAQKEKTRNDAKFNKAKKSTLRSDV